MFEGPKFGENGSLLNVTAGRNYNTCCVFLRQVGGSERNTQYCPADNLPLTERAEETNLFTT